jgi:hypothetical protein
MITPMALAPLMLLQAPASPPEVDAKDLPRAPRGPLTPAVPDLATGRGPMLAARHAARRGPSLAALQLPAGSCRVTDRVPDISGWRAYAIQVPPGGAVKVHVVGGRTGWLRVLAVNAMGRQEEGLLQNRIPTGEAQATYRNPATEPRTVYFIVDTLDLNMVDEAYTFDVIRS